MPTLRLPEDGPRSYRGQGMAVKRGTEVDVEDLETCAYLVHELGYFEAVDSASEILAVAESDGGADEVLEQNTTDDTAGDTDQDAGEEDEDTASEEPDAETRESVVSAPAEFTVPEIRSELETGDWDDHLETLEENEQDGDDRTGVYDAIGVRRAEIEG